MILRVSIHDRANFGDNMIKQNIIVAGTYGRKGHSFPSRQE